MSGRGRGIASFVAGFGTGYLNGKEKERERKRQERIDQQNEELRQVQLKQANAQLAKDERDIARDESLQTGMAEAGAMKVGELRDQNGTVGVSADDFRTRLTDGGVAPEVADQAAPIYAERAQQPGAGKWLSNSFGGDEDGGMGTVKPTSRGDIARTRAGALNDGGKYEQAVNMQEKADKLDIDDLKMRIARGDEQTLADEYDEIFPDGLRLKFERGQDGKLYKFTEDSEGKRSNWQTFTDLNQFKDHLMKLIDSDPNAISQYWQQSRELERQGRQDKMTADKHGQDMRAGELNIKGGESDLRVKAGTEGARIEAAGLSNRAARAGIANTNDEMRHRKVVEGQAAAKARGESADARHKSGDQYRQDFNAAVSVFDKSFKRDAMGNMVGSELDSQLYSQATNVIGAEIKDGATIDDAQAVGRAVYDRAKSDGVSVDVAYKKMKGGKGASNPAYDAMMTQ